MNTYLGRVAQFSTLTNKSIDPQGKLENMKVHSVRKVQCKVEMNSIPF
jgi:hypothetical protein